jgi:hypothetical protein
LTPARERQNRFTRRLNSVQPFVLTERTQKTSSRSFLSVF